jgi:polyhydroxyalkanoate synthase
VNEIEMPVLQIVAEYDHLVPASASKPFNDVVASEDTEIIEHSTGHIGLSVSSSSHENLWPRVGDWLAERSGTEADITATEETEEETVSDETDEDDDFETEETSYTDIETVDGIGPTYAGRLREAGIETVEDLHEVSPEEVADAAGVSEKRVDGWLEQV